jgi:hypothetical protein
MKPHVDPYNSSLTATCFKPERGIVLPPNIWWLKHAVSAMYGPAARRPEPPRTTLLFFAGSTKVTWRNDPRYSQGVRQYLFKRYGNGSVPDVVMVEKVPDMAASMRASKFCLAPLGIGWGIRLSHAMASGCIPVIVQDFVHQPYDDILPYEVFSLRVPQSELETLEARLRAVTPAQLSALQFGVSRYHRAFVWPQTNNLDDKPEDGRNAYYYFIKSLRRRLNGVLAEFHR